ncbi:MAG TPA: alpha/beta hydrolase-fold protein [Ignavibacteriaceae bacterium]|nr:alpha/beta hydrolase-fold protein [Ignavibacteriaceae bacterium]
MKYLLGIFIIYILFDSGFTFCQYDGYILEGTEIRELKSKINNQDYELLINLPYSYKENTGKKYPVFYFCDGFYDFALFSSIYGQQIYDKLIPECFFVGFSYKGKKLNYDKLRRYDYSPTEIVDTTRTGGAPDFLEVVEKEFIPFIQKNYRVDTTFRALGGSSMGGLFTVYAMLRKSRLFNAYVAISPSIHYDSSWIFKLENKFFNKTDALPVSLYMTAAEKELPQIPEFVPEIKRFDQILKARNYKNFRYEFRVLDDAYHSSSKPEGFTRGIKFIFEPLMQNNVVKK